MYLIPITDDCFTLLQNMEAIASHKDIILDTIKKFELNSESTERPEGHLHLLLRPFLLQLPNIKDTAGADSYLKNVRRAVRNFDAANTLLAKMYYLLNCCILYIQLYEWGTYRQTYYMMYAYCLLCFDYNKLRESRI